MLRPLLALVLIAGSASCGSDESSSTAKDAGGDVNVPTLNDAGACGVTTARVSPDPAIHVDQGSMLTFASNPPCGGNHYPFWATWGVHSEPIPRGNWIHNLEHGGVVFLYRCANRAACPDIAAKLEALVATLPADPVCGSQVPPIKNRAIVTPDPELPAGVQVAVAAWGHNLVARCIDDTAFREFYLAHAGRAPENFCSDGSPIVAPSDGGAIDDSGKGKDRDGG
jgi:hypothetical protein